MYCTSCGREVPDSSKFCGHCGAKQDLPNPPSNNQPGGFTPPPGPPPQGNYSYQAPPPPPPTGDRAYDVPPIATARGDRAYEVPQGQYSPPAPPPYSPPPFLAGSYAGVNMPKAGFWIRFVAYLIDGFVLAIVASAIGLPTGLLGAAAGNGNDAASAFAIGGTCIGWLLIVGIGIAYYVVFWAMWGATPGKMVLGLKVISTDGSNLTWGKAILRWIGYVVSQIIPFEIGFIWAAFDSQKQAIHDKIAGTYVVYNR
jgi:uncharacterized RDD family membrane protein YckC